MWPCKEAEEERILGPRVDLQAVKARILSPRIELQVEKDLFQIRACKSI